MEQNKLNINSYNTNLNSQFTFENFVKGENNLFAYNIAKAAAQHPGIYYNPIFIYGDVGLGKTHLLQAIGNQLKDTHNVIYESSEHFINNFTNNNLYSIYKKYIQSDILLIDDIQILLKKEKMQEKFLYILNKFISYENEKQICVTADKHPSEILGLNKKIRAIFEQGVIAEIQNKI